jgi:hypothetical protein
VVGPSYVVTIVAGGAIDPPGWVGRQLAHRICGVNVGAPWCKAPSAVRELGKLSAFASPQEAIVLAGHRVWMQARLLTANPFLRKRA